MEIPDGFQEIEAKVFRKDDELLIWGNLDPEGPFAIRIRIGPPQEQLGPPPPGYEWTGEVRPPKKGELFWSDFKGRVISAIEDETGFNRLGEPTGGRKLLRPVAPPPDPKKKFRIVRDEG
jgi:hypothetical protein